MVFPFKNRCSTGSIGIYIAPAWLCFLSEESEGFDEFEPMDFVEPGHWDLNRSGVIPVSVMAGLWTSAACGVLFSMVYIYRFQEVLKAYQLAEESAAC